MCQGILGTTIRPSFNTTQCLVLIPPKSFDKTDGFPDNPREILFFFRETVTDTPTPHTPPHTPHTDTHTDGQFVRIHCCMFIPLPINALICIHNVYFGGLPASTVVVTASVSGLTHIYLILFISHRDMCT